MNKITVSNVVRNGVIIFTHTEKFNNGQIYTTIESIKGDSYPPRKKTLIRPDGSMSMIHEYRRGEDPTLEVRKHKEKGGKWIVDEISLHNGSTIYERVPFDESKSSAHALKLSDDTIKAISELPATLKKLVAPCVENLIEAAKKAIK